MSQRKKNIRLLIIWMILVVTTVLVYFAGGPSDRLSIPRDLFALQNVSAIDQVQLVSTSQQNTLEFSGGGWTVNGRYKADPQRITVLFAILKQNKVRRRVAKNRTAEVDSLMTVSGVEVRFLADKETRKAFSVTGNPDSGLSYFREEGGESYVVEIPGYRVNLAGIFELDENGWRDPLVFDLNWANLQEVNMLYPGREDSGFDVIFQDRHLSIRQLPQSDSTKLTDFMEDLSLLYVNDYLHQEELNNWQDQLRTTQATIIVTDVGGNDHTVEFFDTPGDNELIIGRIDSSGYALFDFGKVRKILRPRHFFEVREK